MFYKKEENIPDYIQRDIYRLSALLEVVDDKMQNIKNEVEKHFEYIRTCPFEKILELDLNSETFKRIMLEKSNRIYSFDNKHNNLFSAEIESNYNILTTKLLDSILSDRIDFSELDNEKFINQVLSLLDTYKSEIDQTQNQ